MRGAPGAPLVSSTPLVFLTLAFMTLAVLAAWAIRAESLDQRSADAGPVDPPSHDTERNRASGREP